MKRHVNTTIKSQLRRFPRQQCRGLIEASTLEEGVDYEVNVFPGSNAGASLKPVINGMIAAYGLEFSPAAMPGPH